MTCGAVLGSIYQSEGLFKKVLPLNNSCTSKAPSLLDLMNKPKPRSSSVFHEHGRERKKKKKPGEKYLKLPKNKRGADRGRASRSSIINRTSQISAALTEVEKLELLKLFKSPEKLNEACLDV